MANTLKFGNGNWATKDGSTLAYNDESGFNPLPFDFTRASSATVVNKNGLIETVASGIPRIDFKDNTKGALLLEPQRLNYVTQSETFTGYWGLQGASLIADNNVKNPTGNTFSNILNTTTTGTFKSINKNESSAWDSKTLTMSCFAKKKTNDFIYFYNIGSVSGSPSVYFNIGSGTLGSVGSAWSNAKIENYGNDWYRCSATITFGTNTNYLYIANSDGNNNNSSTIGSQTYLWGTQVEEGSYATSYIPTSGSAVTRVAEKCEQNLSNVVSLTEGVIYIDTTNLGNDGTNSNIISQNSVVDTIYCLKVGSNNKIACGLYASSVNVPLNSTSSYPLGTRTKIAFHYKSGNSKLYINGSLEGTNGTAFTLGSSFATALRLLDASSAYNAFPQKSIAREFKVYNNGLTDAELIALTSI